jgi:RNA polymerase sigma factor (sigma-70 family)
MGMKRRYTPRNRNHYARLLGKSLPPRIKKSRLDELVKRLRMGDKSVSEEIITGHIKLTAIIAGGYASLVGYDDEKIRDLFQEGLLALTDCVRHASRGSMHDNNITTYIITRVHGALLDYCGQRSDVHINPRTLRRWKQRYLEKGRKIPTNIGDMRADHQMEESAGSYIVNEVINTDIEELVIMDTLNQVADNKLEKLIIKLRSEGYKYSEMTSLVGISMARISVLLQQIEQRFDEKWG